MNDCWQFWFCLKWKTLSSSYLQVFYIHLKWWFSRPIIYQLLVVLASMALLMIGLLALFVIFFSCWFFGIFYQVDFSWHWITFSVDLWANYREYRELIIKEIDPSKISYERLVCRVLINRTKIFTEMKSDNWFPL